MHASLTLLTIISHVIAQAHPSYMLAPLPLSLPPRASLSEDVIDTPKYGLTYPLPSHIQKQVQNFCTWSSNVVQLDRTGGYVNAAQAITVQHHEAHIVAFLGFTLIASGRGLSEVSLSCYEEPDLLLSFMAFMKVRGEEGQ